MLCSPYMCRVSIPTREEYKKSEEEWNKSELKQAWDRATLYALREQRYRRNLYKINSVKATNLVSAYSLECEDLNILTGFYKKLFK